MHADCVSDSLPCSCSLCLPAKLSYATRHLPPTDSFAYEIRQFLIQQMCTFEQIPGPDSTTHDDFQEMAVSCGMGRRWMRLVSISTTWPHFGGPLRGGQIGYGTLSSAQLPTVAVRGSERVHVVRGQPCAPQRAACCPAGLDDADFQPVSVPEPARLAASCRCCSRVRPGARRHQ